MNVNQVFKLVVGSSVIYAVVAACGHSSGGFGGGHDGGGVIADAMADVNQSGSRLKAQYYAGKDGSRAFAGMYDTMLKQDCAFATASDGTYRCLPVGPKVITAAAHFSDTGCTQPIIQVPKTCAMPTPYIATFDASCGGTTQAHVYPSGSTFTPGADVYIGDAKTCVKVKTPAGGEWVSAGTELPTSQFVQGNLQSE